MRLVTYLAGGDPQVGVVGRDDTVTALADVAPGSPTTMLEVVRAWPTLAPRLADPTLVPTGGTPLDRVQLLAPIPRPARNIFCVGWNYAEHFAEGKAFRKATADADLPAHPAFFSKNPGTVVGPGAKVLHYGSLSNELDWEVELAVVVGRGGRDIAEAGALAHVFGYTVGNDVSVRDVQRSWHGGQWFKGKNFDTHCPLGPWIVTADEIPDPQTLDIWSRIDGEVKQSANTRQMVFTVARILAELSAGMTLEPGDIVLTGTPSGVGFARTPPEYLRPGSVMEMGIDGIGVLRNEVAPA